jgi:hypothetical protein
MRAAMHAMFRMKAEEGMARTRSHARRNASIAAICVETRRGALYFTAENGVKSNF